MAAVVGLSARRYYTDNPIWVDVDTTGDLITDYITLVITRSGNLVYSAKLYTFENKVSFDLSEIVKGLLDEPEHPNLTSGAYLSSNYVNLTISLPNYNQTKTFYRGGVMSNRTNVQLTNNALLSESEKIPVWSSYPAAKYYLDDSSNIVYSEVLSVFETEKRVVVGCNPVYLRFLNTKGGYSYWLFDEWDIKEKYKDSDKISRRNRDLDIGSKPTFELSVNSRAETRYINTMRALLQSTVIDVYNIDNLMQNTTTNSSSVWSPIYNAGGDIEWNPYDSVYDVSFKFDLRLKYNPSLNGNS